MESSRTFMLRAFLGEALTIVIRELDDADAQATVRALIADADVGEVGVVEFVEDFLRRWDENMAHALRSAAEKTRWSRLRHYEVDPPSRDDSLRVVGPGPGSVVSLSDTWTCSECGCRNVEALTVCICGKPRQR